MLHIQEVIVTEGRYDRGRLAAVCDAMIVETNGFSIYHDAEKRAYLKRLAEERGVVILTDSDNAGRQIRAYLESFLPKERVRHAYIPDVPGKERRKSAPSKEGKLGVEGMPSEVLEKALLDAGCCTERKDRAAQFTTADFYSFGLTGHPGSAALRKQLLSLLGLPENLTLKRFSEWADTAEKREAVLSAIEKIRENA